MIDSLNYTLNLIYYEHFMDRVSSTSYLYLRKRILEVNLMFIRTSSLLRPKSFYIYGSTLIYTLFEKFPFPKTLSDPSVGWFYIQTGVYFLSPFFLSNPPSQNLVIRHSFRQFRQNPWSRFQRVVFSGIWGPCPDGLRGTDRISNRPSPVPLTSETCLRSQGRPSWTPVGHSLVSLSKNTCREQL